MKLLDLIEKLSLKVMSARDCLDVEVTGGYASDLLSDVMANSNEGNVWVTLQAHENIVAVASLRGLAGIVLVGGREPERDTVEKAVAEKVPILVSSLAAFELVGRLYALGIRSAANEKV